MPCIVGICNADPDHSLKMYFARDTTACVLAVDIWKSALHHHYIAYTVHYCISSLPSHSCRPVMWYCENATCCSNVSLLTRVMPETFRLVLAEQPISQECVQQRLVVTWPQLLLLRQRQPAGLGSHPHNTHHAANVTRCQAGLGASDTISNLPRAVSRPEDNLGSETLCCQMSSCWGSCSRLERHPTYDQLR